MARIRTIKPEFPQSESMGRVSRDARLLFVELWTICDDSGITRGASRMLASLLFPYDDDAPALIDGWLDELERENCISRYEAAGSTYIKVEKWAEHQRIDKPSPSKFPQFAEGSRRLANDLGRTKEGTKYQGPRTKEGIKEVEAREKFREPTPAAPPALVEPSKPKTTKGSSWPPDAVVSADWIADAVAARARAGKLPLDLKPEAERFANHFAANGKTMRDWRRAWLNWATSQFVDNLKGLKNGSIPRKHGIGDTLREMASELAEIENIQPS